MSDEKSQEDPSMEDILASIRRIITDDEEADGSAENSSGAKSPNGGTEADDVLELTQMLQDDGTTVDLSQKDETETTKEPESEPEPMAETESETAAAEDSEPETATESESAAEPEPEPEPDTATDTPVEVQALISEATSTASIDALSKLAGAGGPAPASTSALRVGGQGGTVEDMVIEILRPMMREWLDQNLPKTVECIVQKEIRRLVRQADTD